MKTDIHHTDAEDIASVSQRTLPTDERVPGMNVALDTSVMAEMLAPAVGVESEVVGVTPFYARYKPGENCLVGYRCDIPDGAREHQAWPTIAGSYTAVKFYSEERYPKAREKAAARRWIREGVNEPYFCSDELRAICVVFPNDALLEGLRVISNQKKLQRLLYLHLRGYPKRSWRISDSRLELSVASYKPERRAVLRCATRATHRESGEKKLAVVYLRIYADGRGENIAKLNRELAQDFETDSRVSIPAALGYLVDRNALMIAEAPGVTLADLLVGGEPVSVMAESVKRSATALAALHESLVRALSFPHSAASEIEIGAVSSSLNNWGIVDRKLVDSTASALLSFRNEIPGNDARFTGLAHGDFHPGQALITDGNVSLIDFDRTHTGDQVRDLGEFCARLTFAFRENESLAETLETVFLENYSKIRGVDIDGRRFRFWKMHRLFSLAQAPVRELWINPLEPVEWTINKCQELLN